MKADPACGQRIGDVRVIPLAAVDPVPLPGGSWSRMLVTQRTAPGTQTALGYSIFRPGTVTAAVRHEVEEVAYVVSGRGELRLDEGTLPFGPGQALFIPARVWHAVANTGTDDVVMVFAFSHPDYPPTARRMEEAQGRHSSASTAAEIERLALQVAWACRILAMEGHGDLTLGHVSARLPDGARILMKRKGVGLDEVTAADVLMLDLEGRKLAGDGEVHLEAVLHTEIYKHRADVGAVIHTHPPYATAFGAVDSQLLYLSHDALLFTDGVAVYEDSSLVLTPEAGAAVARTLGPRRVIVLRNHGVIAVGADLRWAVLTALAFERAVRLQALAAMLGPARPIPAEDVMTLSASKYREEFLDEYWAYWLRSLRRRGLAAGMPEVPAPAGDGE